MLLSVIPANAGIRKSKLMYWTPVCTGVTKEKEER